MIPPDPAFLVVGHLRKAHGTRGELSVLPLTDHPERTFVPGARFPLAALEGGGAGGEVPDPEHPPLEVEEVRPFQDGYLVRFRGVNTRSRSELLRGRYLLRSLAEVEPPGRDEVFHHELPGMEVFLTDGTRVGVVEEVYDLDPTDLVEVRRDSGGTVLIPFTRPVVAEVDRAGRRLRIDPPEGLLEL